ncbi:YkgJ family cysteine cluster protein [Streptosporangium lutulentum]|uniref:Fe-S-cluster containining protein n=1 Tax=Streptosporangium lutulentum TaxID=1461250 RepID=A0ABT9Q9B8_9ACTN|nr:YkgJ family cysteine cluster protein [Streptosporangium lutulentum]MDP9843338.1 Fe-S-cluster containining protein [Streptosporangium lutulentum]
MSEWTDRQDQLLDELYAKVPSTGCKGLCQEHCTTIAGGRREAQRMAEAGFQLPTSVAALVRKRRTVVATSEPCAALGGDGRCQAYEVRPLICRLWGAVDGLPCEHGCMPEGGRLTDTEAAQMIKRIKNI